MIKRRGFSLIEIMVALARAGAVALIAYGTLRAAFDSDARLSSYRANSESLALMRGVVRDALRHTVEESSSGHPAFRIEHGSAGDDSGDAIQFLSRGVSPPLGAKGLWSLTLTTSEHGLRIDATPMDDSLATPFTATTPGIVRLRASVIRDASQRDWAAEWDSPDRRPYAVRLDFIGHDGAALGSPLVVVTTIGLN